VRGSHERPPGERGLVKRGGVARLPLGGDADSKAWEAVTEQPGLVVGLGLVCEVVAMTHTPFALAKAWVVKRHPSRTLGRFQGYGLRNSD